MAQQRRILCERILLLVLGFAIAWMVFEIQTQTLLESATIKTKERSLLQGDQHQASASASAASTSISTTPSSPSLLAVGNNNNDNNDNNDNNNDNNHNYNHNNNYHQHHKYNSKVQFVFVIGLEGTGHHLMGSIIEGSPSMKHLERLQIFPRQIDRMQCSLFQRQIKKGKKVGTDTDTTGSGSPTTGASAGTGPTSTRLLNAFCNPLQDGTNDTPPVNTTQLQNEVTESLVTIHEMVLQQHQDRAAKNNNIKNNNNNMSVIRVPFNTVGNGCGRSHGKDRFGELSYPNFGGPCRYMNYPNIDLLYDACDRAQVDCGHVYLYRNPYDVLYSTTINRKFNPTLLTGMHLYTTLLHVIAAQLQTHASRTLGCYGFYEDSTDNWWNNVKDLWGWTDEKKYANFMNQTYRPPDRSTTTTTTTTTSSTTSGSSTTARITKANQQDKQDMIPLKYRPYMKSFLQAHQRVVEICKAASQEEKARNNF